MATGEDAYQHEGGNLNNDWAHWEAREPSPIESGEPLRRRGRFLQPLQSDFGLAARDGQNAHRIGSNGAGWSRRRDATTRVPSCINGEMIDAMRKRGFVVFLNLWHFTLPLWAADGGDGKARM